MIYTKFKELFEKDNENSKSQFFCKLLLEKYKTAIVPGIAFGNDNGIRLSYATSEQEIEKGLTRIKQFIQFLKS